MKILVTGGTGFLGGSVVKQLLSLNHDVRCLVRDDSDISSLGSLVEIVYGDVTQVETLILAFKGCQGVIHLAAYVEIWSKDEAKFEKVNVAGLQNMLVALKVTESVEKFVHVSSFTALGPTGTKLGDESQYHQGKSFTTEYEKSKWRSDLVARRAAKEGMPVVIVYPGLVYGPGRVSSGNLVVKLITEHLRGKPLSYFGTGKQRFSFAYVDDVSSGIISALEKGVPMRPYLLSGENTTFSRLFAYLEVLTGTKAPDTSASTSFLGKMAGFASVAKARVGGSAPALTPKCVEYFNHEWAYSSPKTEEELGYKSRTLRQGLQDTLKWWRGVHIEL